MYHRYLPMLDLEIIPVPFPDEMDMFHGLVEDKDLPVLASAVMGRADHFITGDKRLLARIEKNEAFAFMSFSPAEFLDRVLPDILVGESQKGDGPMSYYFNKIVDLPFDEAVDRVKAELKKDGFGIMTEIDVQKTLKEKLGVDFRPYRILGACNPPFAYKALLAEDKIGTMLPLQCYRPGARPSQVEVAAIDPPGLDGGRP